MPFESKWSCIREALSDIDWTNRIRTRATFEVKFDRGLYSGFAMFIQLKVSHLKHHRCFLYILSYINYIIIYLFFLILKLSFFTLLPTDVIFQVLNLHGRQLRRIDADAFQQIQGRMEGVLSVDGLEIRLNSWCLVNIPLFTGFYHPGGAGFLPSTVWLCYAVGCAVWYCIISMIWYLDVSFFGSSLVISFTGLETLLLSFNCIESLSAIPTCLGS